MRCWDYRRNCNEAEGSATLDECRCLSRVTSFHDPSRVRCKLVDAADKSVENSVEISKRPTSVDVEWKLLLEITTVIDSKDEEADDTPNVPSFVIAG